MSVLYDKLREYCSSDKYAFHMPGHKRNERFGFCNPIEIDITEIDGFDDLHHAEGILKECMDYAAACYGANKTYFLVNGSSGGLLSAITAVTNYRDKIIVARNCHKSVYNAVEIRGLEPVYIYPEYIGEYGISGGIKPEAVRRALSENVDAKAVVIVSPTYDGVCSDIKRIADIVHSFNCVLIVDEAHGAHFRYNDYFPETALELGADIVIQSVHKTLPSFTQTALLHVKSERVDISRIQKALSIYQSSSPSYVFLAGIDKCIRWMEDEGAICMTGYCKTLETLRCRLKELTNLVLISEAVVDNYAVKALDRGKIIIHVKNFNGGRILYDVLRLKYNVQPEMSTESSVTLMTSVGDSKEALEYLGDVLLEVDEYFENTNKLMELLNAINYKLSNEVKTFLQQESSIAVTGPVIENNIVFSPARAAEMSTGIVGLENCAGKVSADYIYIYPPGIPLLVPGERIEQSNIDIIKEYLGAGLKVHGLDNMRIKVISD